MADLQPEGPPAIVYARYSPRRKRHGTLAGEPDSLSIQTQKSVLRQFCAFYGNSILAEYEDEAVSGTDPTRKGLEAAIAHTIKARGVLVIYSLSRLARDVGFTIDTFKRLTKKGCRLMSYAERIDTSTAFGWCMFQMAAVWAEFERNVMAERTSQGMQKQQAAGYSMSSQAPYGFRLAPQNGVDEGRRRIEPDPAEQKMIHRLLAIRAQGLSMGRIAKVLTAEGYRNRKGNPFEAQTIKRILKRYQGENGQPGQRVDTRA